MLLSNERELEMIKPSNNISEAFRNAFLRVRRNTTGSVVFGSVETYYDESNAPILNVIKLGDGVYKYEFLYDTQSFIIDSKKGIRYATDEDTRQRIFD